MTKLESIQQYIKDLPSKDQPIAKIFIDKRQFEELLELIKSAVVKINKYHKRLLENVNNSIEINYQNTSLEGLEEMRYQLELYIEIING